MVRLQDLRPHPTGHGQQRHADLPPHRLGRVDDSQAQLEGVRPSSGERGVQPEPAPVCAGLGPGVADEPGLGKKEAVGQAGRHPALAQQGGQQQGVLCAVPGGGIQHLAHRFAAMARMSPLLPLIGGGRTRFQPIYVGDVATAIANACEGRAKPGTTYGLGGPEVLSFRALLDRTQQHAGRNRRYLPLPFWLAKFAAALTAPLPNALRLSTVDQVRMLQSDNVVGAAALAEGRTIQGLGVAGPHAIDTIVPGDPESYRVKGQYSHYRG